MKAKEMYKNNEVLHYISELDTSLFYALNKELPCLLYKDSSYLRRYHIYYPLGISAPEAQSLFFQDGDFLFQAFLHQLLSEHIPYGVNNSVL